MHKEEAESYLHKKVEDGELSKPGICQRELKITSLISMGPFATIFQTRNQNVWPQPELYPDALETLNGWYDQGHLICFFTSRVEAHRKVTEKWLNNNGFKYHSLLMGKPRGGNYHWIDNHLVKATRYNGKFTDLIEKEVTIEVFDDGQSQSQ